MTENKNVRAGQGTFAKLYDVHEELSKKTGKPLGRPRKKVQRKPTTIHLTQSESRNLSKLQLELSETMSVNRSELVGLAIEVLGVIVEAKEEKSALESLEALRSEIYDFLKS